MSENKKVYVGQGYERQTKYGDILNITFYPDDIQAILNNTDSSGRCHIAITRLRNVGSKGQTHGITLNEYMITERGANPTPAFGGQKPALGSTSQTTGARHAQAGTDIEEDDIPF